MFWVHKEQISYIYIRTYIRKSRSHAVALPPLADISHVLSYNHVVVGSLTKLGPDKVQGSPPLSLHEWFLHNEMFFVCM